MPEVLGDGGLYFDSVNPADIGEVLYRMFRDHHLRARCARIAAERSSSYSWSRCADETFAFLAEVARNSRRN
jgi:glycosyltransferase involved in cell wall biosynthesis